MTDAPDRPPGVPAAGEVRGFILFSTPIGDCGILWGDRGVLGLALPGETVQATREPITRRHPEAREGEAPAWAGRMVEQVRRHLAGDLQDFAGVALVMDGVPPFHQQVYREARQVLAGTTTTYGELAARLGSPGAARAVGQALGRNPFPLVVPCHRVLAANGRIGGFSAPGGTATKRRMLAIEGVAGPGSVRAPAPDGLGFDPQAALAHPRAADRRLGEGMDVLAPLPLEVDATSTAFASLARAIVHQQRSPNAAATIHGRFCARFAGAPSCPGPPRSTG